MGEHSLVLDSRSVHFLFNIEPSVRSGQIRAFEAGARKVQTFEMLLENVLRK